MDNDSLRTLLEHTSDVAPEPGPVIARSLSAGRRLRQRRRATIAASLSAAAVVLAGVVPAVILGARHQPTRPRPAAPVCTGAAGTAYVAVDSYVVPISLADNAPCARISLHSLVLNAGAFVDTAAASPNGRTIYVLGEGASDPIVTPIDTKTNTAMPAITLAEPGAASIVIAPDGKTAYVSTDSGVVPINTSTKTAGEPIARRDAWRLMAFTPNGKILYALGQSGTAVAAIQTSSNRVTRISLPAVKGPEVPSGIVFTPDGKTAYVLEGVQEGKSGASAVVPINVATSTPLAPIRIGPSGTAGTLVMAPDGRTAYVESPHAVTPINTATNRAEPSFSLPESAAYAYAMLIAPSGKTLYVFTGRGVVPIKTGSGEVLPIIGVPGMAAFADAAITPNGNTIYVGAAILGRRKIAGHWFRGVVGGGVVPISTATNTAGRFISLGFWPSSITFEP
jgi:DNA-binding beta-propeller fold protein YncE